MNGFIGILPLKSVCKMTGKTGDGKSAKTLPIQTLPEIPVVGYVPLCRRTPIWIVAFQLLLYDLLDILMVHG
jgi:hypothetical protein